MNIPAISLPVEVVDLAHSGQTKSDTPKPFYILNTYVSLPGIKFPQACKLFSNRNLTPGHYVVPLTAQVKEGRPFFDLDLSAAQPSKSAAA